MRRPRFGKYLVLLAVGATAAGLTACSSSSSSTAASSGTAAATSGQAPEKSTITIDTLDTSDAAPLWVAVKEGFFKQQGLTVNINVVQAGPDAFPGQAAHTVDFAVQNYVSLFAEANKNPSLGLRIVNSSDVSAPNTDVIMVPKNSGITSPAQLKGKLIGFSAPGYNTATLALDEQLKGYGITPKDYTNDPVGFGSMTQDLASGAIAAAFSVPPFITTMETSLGAHQLMDLMTGPMASFPVLGWTTTAYEEQHYPKTVAAFQRAMNEALQVSASNSVLVRQVLAANVKSLTTAEANIMALPTYVPTLSLTSMQRVATVMEQFGALPSTFNVAPLVTPSVGS
jgi:NitT/TauT family transport system substrate-binding protein